MENMFTAGELSKLQKISKQTLLFYDKIGLFKPSYIDKNNGYRYYSADQLDYLDSILIMKKAGFSLEEIKNHMTNLSTKNSLKFLKDQINVIDEQINNLNIIKSRLNNRCLELEKAINHIKSEVKISYFNETYVLYHDVKEPYDTKEISIATKKCYAQALDNNLPIYYECGVSVPIKHLLNKEFTKATLAFVTIDQNNLINNIKKLPSGLTASLYHLGKYEEISKSYEKLIKYCHDNNYKIISDSYEFCINDYITSKDEDEFITKIVFYISK